MWTFFIILNPFTYLFNYLLPPAVLPKLFDDFYFNRYQILIFRVFRVVFFFFLVIIKALFKKICNCQTDFANQAEHKCLLTLYCEVTSIY